MADKERLVVGFDLGGTKMAAVLVDSRFRVVARVRKKTRGKEEDDLFERIAALVRSLFDEAHVAPSDVAGIGIGSPGPLDPRTGVIGDTPNLGWKDFPLGERMRKAFGLPVTVGNDVDMGTYGEYHFGSARGAKTVLGVFPGTGIGGGLIVNGMLHTGASGAAAEVGHIVLDPEGPRCGCGRRGCLEAYAGRLAIAGRAWGWVARDKAPALKRIAGTDPAEYRSGALAKAIEEGDALIEEVVRDAAQKIGLVIAGLVNVLSPDVVVLGGGLVEAMPRLFQSEVKREVRQRALPGAAAAAKVLVAELGDDAVMMGAARVISETLDGRPWPPTPPAPA